MRNASLMLAARGQQHARKMRLRDVEKNSDLLCVSLPQPISCQLLQDSNGLSLSYYIYYE